MHVFSLNPKQLDRFRDRHTVAGAKDDRRDAFVLADSLRTDRPAFRRVRPDHPRVVELRELSRVEDDLGEDLRRLSNRLREQLHRFFPQALTLCAAADEPWFWALVERVPTPAHAQRLPVKTVAAVLKVYRVRRSTVESIREALQTPAVHVAPGTVEAARAHISLLLPRLRLLQEQRTAVARRIEALLEELGQEAIPGEHRDVTILRSFPGVGRVVAATVLAEAAQPLAERDYQTLRAHGGIAPVTRKSGKKLSVSMRYGCNPRLRNAFYHWARTSVQPPFFLPGPIPIGAPPRQLITPFGFYVSGDYQLGRRWTIGSRFDRSQRGQCLPTNPLTLPGCDFPVLSPVIFTDNLLQDTGGSLLLTYMPSEFSLIRAQLRRNHYGEGRTANEFVFQFQFAMGAHGAHPF